MLFTEVLGRLTKQMLEEPGENRFDISQGFVDTDFWRAYLPIQHPEGVSNLPDIGKAYISIYCDTETVYNAFLTKFRHLLPGRTTRNDWVYDIVLTFPPPTEAEVKEYLRRTIIATSKVFGNIDIGTGAPWGNICKTSTHCTHRFECSIRGSGVALFADLLDDGLIVKPEREDAEYDTTDPIELSLADYFVAIENLLSLINDVGWLKKMGFEFTPN